MHMGMDWEKITGLGGIVLIFVIFEIPFLFSCFFSLVFARLVRRRRRRGRGKVVGKGIGGGRRGGMDGNAVVGNTRSCTMQYRYTVTTSWKWVERVEGVQW